MVKVQFIISRHGQTDANAQRIFQGSLVNYPLNDTGKRQADALAEALKHSKIDWILTSQFDRAIETASHVAKYHPQAVSTIDERLREISWGVADGKYIDEVDHMVDPVVDEWNAGDFDARVPEGESANECKARVVAAFADILAKVRQNKHKTVFINTHGRTLRIMMAILLDKTLVTMKKYKHTNCSYHVVSVDVDEDNTQAPVGPMELQFVLDSFYVHDHLSAI